MRKFFLFIVITLSFCNFVYAEFDTSTGYTLIDCVDWNDITWVAFDSTKPYQTLKWWIEKTINYINSNINKTWNELTSSGKVFNIKVNCTINNLLDNNINLDYKWTVFNNTILIEWVWENSLIIENIKINLSQNTWNIIFKNANFRNYSFPYFYDEIQSPFSKTPNPNSNWIKIINSYIELKDNNDLWKFMIYNYVSSNVRFYNNKHYSNGQYIENSIINIEIDSNYNFKLPVILKNSKVIFTNKNGTWVYDINFSEDWNPNNPSKFTYSALISNEFDFWWNNFLSENTSSIAYINNKFSNFNNFNFSATPVCFNNYVENETSIDIKSSLYMYNNIFKTWFSDVSDINNLRKNYTLNDIWPKWVSWVYKKHNNLSWFDINMTSSSLYEEITWQYMLEFKNSVYVIYEN